MANVFPLCATVCGKVYTLSVTMKFPPCGVRYNQMIFILDYPRPHFHEFFVTASWKGFPSGQSRQYE